MAAIPILISRIPPDPLSPARRAVAGALESVADVYRAMKVADHENGGEREHASGLTPVAR